MNWMVIAAVSLASGVLGSLGMGSGAVLLLYLRVYGGFGQLEAQGINLIFFLPIALLSILLHTRNRLIDWKAAAICAAAGLPGVFAGVWLGNVFGTELLSKLFAAMLIVMGIREVLRK